ncbi:hypothetical protein R3P38DRAFT_3195939 [Favolaschia claudopus]|uniref:Uncharacterized protein n=1 Tax=Favolaschia claudopus TaxID=2862362 RepID=A0AAW0BCG2_9AGAR
MSGRITHEDRALKQEALLFSRDDSHPISMKLVSWLSVHAAPSKPGLKSHKQKFAELRARVAARKARLDRLVELRRRALESSAHKWPPSRSHPHHHENIEGVAQEQRERELRKKLEDEKKRAVQAARMKDLEDRWAAGAERRKRFVVLL